MADTVPTETLSLNYEKVRWTYSEKDAATDSFDFRAAEDGGKAGLLLPAVQMVVEGDSPDAPDGAAAMGDGAVILIKDSVDAGETAYEVKLDDLLITSYNPSGSAGDDDDKWIDILTINEGRHQPTAKGESAGLRSDGELVQAVSDADMGGDFIL